MIDRLQITEEDLLALSSSANLNIVQGIVNHQDLIFEYGVVTHLRLAHFMAQIAHESAHFRTTVEYASGRAYEGRKDLGNVQKGDGERYRGRGLIQTTGRANYRRATVEIRKKFPDAPDFEENPLYLWEFPWALLSALTYWDRNSLNHYADQDDVLTLTKRINGGTNGLADRKRYLAKAKRIWAAPMKDSNYPTPTLHFGSKGKAVALLQKALIEAGVKVAVDGDFGNYTAHAVRSFQRSKGLTADAVVGPVTWAALSEFYDFDTDV